MHSIKTALFLLLFFPFISFGQPATATDLNEGDKLFYNFLSEFSVNWSTAQSSAAFWNDHEKSISSDPFFARQFLARPGHPYILEKYLVLDPAGKYQRIRFYFISTDDREPVLVDLYAATEEGHWKFYNPLLITTVNWNRNTIGEITFYYPPSRMFDSLSAVNSARYYEGLKRRFSDSSPKTFNYYITGSNPEMEQILGVKGLIPRDVPGLAFTHRRFLISANASPWYPHEVAHMVLSGDTIHPLINEGFATWQGGAMGRSFLDNKARLQATLKMHPDADFDDLLEGRLGHQAYYATGAVILEAAMVQGGSVAVKYLLGLQHQKQGLIDGIARLFAISETDITAWWKFISQSKPAS